VCSSAQSGLFFYDIYWVFFTPVMIGVAKNIDGPIKLMFEISKGTVDTDPTFSILGLGDIVLPGTVLLAGTPVLNHVVLVHRCG
jgi:hypothetical protein